MKQGTEHAHRFDPALTINDIVARHPESIPVFNRFGMDTCCGGGVSVDEAARRDGVDAAAVFAALDEALAGR
jgi:regulator of cell morphogenesis and NO signaling